MDVLAIIILIIITIIITNIYIKDANKIRDNAPYKSKYNTLLTFGIVLPFVLISNSNIRLWAWLLFVIYVSLLDLAIFLRGEAPDKRKLKKKLITMIVAVAIVLVVFQIYNMLVR